MSMIVKKDHYLRLVITFNAGDGTPKLDPPPMVSLYRDGTHHSSLTLPVIASSSAM
jgi:hypothetical protein